MIDVLIMLLFASCVLSLCRAITLAHRSGARGLLAYVVWALEASAKAEVEAARWLRDFHAWHVAWCDAKRLRHEEA